MTVIVMIMAVSMCVVMLMVVLMVVIVMMLVPVAVSVFVRLLQRDIVAFFLCVTDADNGPCSGDAALEGFFQRHRYAGQAKVIELINKAFAVRQQFQQRGHQHIAGRPHIAFQVECFHDDTPMWLIMLAR